ncbi:hypothetical protein C6A85_10665, partial [Mycobacterium sp. ITM-2017-0098]
AIGLSSGETNSLLAFGIWQDLEPMLDEIEASGMYGDELTGACGISWNSAGFNSGILSWPDSDIGALTVSGVTGTSGVGVMS